MDCLRGASDHTGCVALVDVWVGAMSTDSTFTPTWPADHDRDAVRKALADDAVCNYVARREHDKAIEALRTARLVISQYLATAEQWRYNRVMWAFAIMLGEIPEDTPEPLSWADEKEIYRNGGQ